MEEPFQTNMKIFQSYAVKAHASKCAGGLKKNFSLPSVVQTMDI